MRRYIQYLVFFAAIAGHARLGVGETFYIHVAPPSDKTPRVEYGIDRLSKALKDVGNDVVIGEPDPAAKVPGRDVITINASIQKETQPPESYSIETRPDGSTWLDVPEGTQSGALYACLDLANRIREAKSLPTALKVRESPFMSVRGPCIGMQKTYILPGRKVYEYPYTPENFPFFYDKAFWTKYLDMLADNRFNTLYIWNGQPFASLVRVKEYPEAIEVPDEVFEKNVEMYRWIVTEADRRGVRVVQMFYSIILPRPLAEKNGISTQLKEPTPLANDYMRRAISEFVVQYPNVGLMACLGEALQGQQNQNHWLNDVIIAGLKDGIARAGLKEEPPLIIRTHATDLRQALPDALKLYKNIDTEAKFNGESLTTYEPRGKRQIVHQAMSKLANVHIANVHILANLEPFRYGAQRFIKQSVIAMRDRLGAKGLHLYPLAYWSWPDAGDNVTPSLSQIDRDWIWFEAWGRYAWNPDVDDASDHKYWVDRLTAKYGNAEAAEKILAAYNDSGECAPMLIRRFGITEGNRQTLSLGMTLDELVHPEKHGQFEELWESQAPPGERLKEFVEKELAKQQHEGETPASINEAVLNFSAKAVAAIDSAEAGVSANRDEFERLKNDVHCIRALSQNYVAKVNAAVHVLRYEQTHDIAEMKAAEKDLAESLDHFRTLTMLTKDTYRFANTMQTNQRKIPVTGGTKENRPANYHWTQLLPIYEGELTDFRQQVLLLEQGNIANVDPSTRPAVAAKWKPAGEMYPLKAGEKPFDDADVTLTTVAPELNGLTGVRISYVQAVAGKYKPIEFVADEPVQILIGYVQSDDKAWRKPPNLETDALAAEHGGIDAILPRAIKLSNGLTVNVHTMTYAAGRHTLDVRGGDGAFIVLGAVPQSFKLK